MSHQTRSAVFAAVLSAGGLSRTQIAQRTALSPSTVTKAVAPLVTNGYLVETGIGTKRGGAGRPQTMLAVNRERHAIVGIKLHPDHVTGVLTDMGAHVLARARRRLRAGRFERTMTAACSVVDELIAGRASQAEPLGLGVALGGHVDVAAGRLVHSSILGWHDEDVAGPLRAGTGLLTIVGNDLDALTVAERWFGKGRGVDSFAVVSIGAGIGCGLLLHGRLYRSATGVAGELGHIPVEPDGPACRCGSRGCVESLASEAAVLRMVQERGGPVCSSVSHAARIARADPGADGEAARAAFARAGHALGCALATLCNLLGVQLIILSGEGVVAHDLFGPALEVAWRAHAFSTAARDCELTIDAVDDDLWARGAACLVVDEALSAI
jgi:predicted NBD/HSP70 family sugar kinase